MPYYKRMYESTFLGACRQTNVKQLGSYGYYNQEDDLATRGKLCLQLPLHLRQNLFM